MTRLGSYSGDREDAELTLDQRLARFDPVRHGCEVMQVLPVGAERW